MNGIVLQGTSVWHPLDLSAGLLSQANTFGIPVNENYFGTAFRISDMHRNFIGMSVPSLENLSTKEIDSDFEASASTKIGFVHHL